jgi:hypothetical protein
MLDSKKFNKRSFTKILKYKVAIDRVTSVKIGSTPIVPTRNSGRDLSLENRDITLFKPFPFIFIILYMIL